MLQQKKEQPNFSNKNKPKKSFARFMGAGLQMGVTIYLGAQLGKWLDGKYPSDKNWYTMICVLFFVFASLYLFIKQVNSFNEE